MGGGCKQKKQAKTESTERVFLFSYFNDADSVDPNGANQIPSKIFSD